MKLTLASENSIMILYFLAKEKRRISISEFAVKLQAPANHLHKLIQLLAKKGYVQSYAGKVGGVELVANPSKVTVLEIIEHFEGPISFCNCLLRKENCTLLNSCSLKKELADASDFLRKRLAKKTIKSLVLSKE